MHQIFLKHGGTERLDRDAISANYAWDYYYSTLNTGPQQEKLNEINAFVVTRRNLNWWLHWNLYSQRRW